MDKNLSVLVYGTLRPGDSNYNYFIEPYAHVYEPFRLSGYAMWAGQGYPYIVPGTDDDTVLCDLVTFTDQSEYEDALEGLDRLEGYKSAGSSKNHYDRTIVSASSVTYGNVSASVYVAAPRVIPNVVRSLVFVPDGDWLRYDRENNSLPSMFDAGISS